MSLTTDSQSVDTNAKPIECPFDRWNYPLPPMMILESHRQRVNEIEMNRLATEEYQRVAEYLLG